MPFNRKRELALNALCQRSPLYNVSPHLIQPLPPPALPPCPVRAVPSRQAFIIKALSLLPDFTAPAVACGTECFKLQRDDGSKRKKEKSFQALCLDRRKYWAVLSFHVDLWLHSLSFLSGVDLKGNGVGVTLEGRAQRGVYLSSWVRNEHGLA